MDCPRRSQNKPPSSLARLGVCQKPHPFTALRDMRCRETSGCVLAFRGHAPHYTEIIVGDQAMIFALSKGDALLRSTVVLEGFCKWTVETSGRGARGRLPLIAVMARESTR